jgi:hypothetical protein
MDLMVRLTATSLLVTLSCSTAAATPNTYKFVKIVDSAGAVKPVSFPSLNAHGAVAFRGEFSDGSGIFTGDGGSLKTIADTSGLFSGFGNPAINDSGVAAFFGQFENSTAGVYTGDGGLLTTIAAPGGPHFPAAEPTINNSGTVAYFALISTLGGAAVFKGNGGPATMVANASGPFRYFSSPQINDAGDVAFMADHKAINTIGYYFRAEGEPLATVVQGPGAFGGGVRPSLNNDGIVAYIHTSPATGYGIFTWNGGNAVKAIDNLGPYYDLGQIVDINNLGVIAFQAKLDNKQIGIYTGVDPAQDRVIEVGDSLFGSALTELYGNPQINDRGDVAFTYRLDDGTYGIAVARVVPEPAVGLLAMFALIQIAYGIRKR